MSALPRVLILHRWRGPWPMRRWEARRLRAWRESGGFETAYSNIAFPIDRDDLIAFAPDLIVYDATALAARQLPAALPALHAVIEALDPVRAARIACPLDEFLANGTLNDLIDKAGIDRVYSAAPASVWPSLYPRSFARGAVLTMLTAYLDDGLYRAAREPVRPNRRLWLGYRTCEADPRFGAIGALKAEIGERAADWARARGLATDVRGVGQGIKLGDAWLKFLRQTRITVGVEGGSDILDRDGNLATTHRARDPLPASSNQSRPLGLRALSPRHLEAAACGVAQVLVEGDYSGVLEPGRHYLPVRRDLANLEDQLEHALADATTISLVRAARADLFSDDRLSWNRKLQDIRAEVLT